MDEHRKLSEPGHLRVSAELVGGLCGDAPPIPIEHMAKHAVEKAGRQIDLADQLQLGQFIYALPSDRSVTVHELNRDTCANGVPDENPLGPHDQA